MRIPVISKFFEYLRKGEEARRIVRHVGLMDALQLQPVLQKKVEETTRTYQSNTGFFGDDGIALSLWPMIAEHYDMTFYWHRRSEDYIDGFLDGIRACLLSNDVMQVRLREADVVWPKPEDKGCPVELKNYVVDFRLLKMPVPQAA